MKAANKTVATLLAAGLTLGIATSAFAFGGHGDRCGGMSKGGASQMRALYQLDSLSDDQRTELKEIMRAERDSMRDLRDAMQDNRDAIMDAMQDNAGTDKIEPLAKKQGDLIAKMTVARVKLRDKINAVLTEEQQKELSKLKSQRGGFGEKGRHGGYQSW